MTHKDKTNLSFYAFEVNSWCIKYSHVIVLMAILIVIFELTNFAFIKKHDFKMNKLKLFDI